MPFFTDSLLGAVTSKPNAHASLTAVNAANGGSIATPGAPTRLEMQNWASANNVVNQQVFFTNDDTDDENLSIATFLVDEEGIVLSTGGASSLSDTADYSQAFVVGDWAAQQLVVTAATHGQGTNPQIQVFEGAAAPFSPVGLEDIDVAADGSVTLTVPSGDEFSGIVVIS